MQSQLEQASKLMPQSKLQELLKNHGALVTLVKEENWVNVEKSGAISNNTASVASTSQGAAANDRIAVFERHFAGTLHLPPNIQPRFTMAVISPRVDQLLIPSSCSTLCAALVADLEKYTQDTGRGVSAEELMNAMGIPSMPRLKDLELEKVGAQPHVASCKIHPERFYGEPESHCFGFVVRDFSVGLGEALR